MQNNQVAEGILIVLKTIGRWIVIAALIFVAMVISFYAYIKIIEHNQNKPKLVNSLGHMTLGESLNDVLFKVEGLIKSESTHEDENKARYFNDQTGFGVEVTSAIVTSILYRCKADLDYFNVNGIFCNDTSDLIAKKYNELRILCDEDIVTFRAYDAINYGLRYYLISNKVIAFRIFEPSVLKSKNVNWKSC